MPSIPDGKLESWITAGVNDRLVERALDLYGSLEHSWKNLIEQEWNVNLLRVSLDSVWMDDALIKDLDKLIDFAEINGMYVLLNPHQIDNSIEGDLPNGSVTDLMNKLSLR